MAEESTGKSAGKDGGGEDYDAWTWQQIKQAILGSADISTADEENQLAGVSDPHSFYTAADKFDFAGSALTEVREFLAGSVNRLLGPAGSWGGDAAETINGIMQGMLKAIDDYSGPVANNKYRSPIDTAAFHLNTAIQKVREADKKAAEATVNKYKDDPNPSATDVPWRTDGASTIVDVSRYPEIEQELTQALREIIKDLAGAYQTATGNIKEPIQHAFVQDGQIVDTSATTWIGDANDAPTTTGASGKSTVDRTNTTKTNDGKPAGKKSSSLTSADNQSSPGSDTHHKPDSPDISESGASKSVSHSSSIAPAPFDAGPGPGQDQPSVSSPNFNGGTGSTHNSQQSAFPFAPNWNGSASYAPGSGVKSSIRSPDLSGLDGNFAFDPQTHVESYDPNSLLGARPGNHLDTPRFRDGPLDVSEFEKAVVPGDLAPTGPIGNSLLGHTDVRGVPTDFRSGNAPPPKLSSLKGFDGGEAFPGLGGTSLSGQGSHSFEQHSYRGNGFLTEGEMTGAAAGTHSSGLPGGYGGGGENPLGSRGGMPPGGGMTPFREEEHGHGQPGWLREDDDVWDREKDDKRKDRPRGR